MRPDVVASQPTIEVLATMGDWGTDLDLDWLGSCLAFFEGSSRILPPPGTLMTTRCRTKRSRGSGACVAVRTADSGTALTVSFFIDGHIVGPGLHESGVDSTSIPSTPAERTLRAEARPRGALRNWKSA